MRFSIENIGAINKAIVDIDGITIIAGENNVGKSTIGKALFAFLRNMNDWKKIYDQVCVKAITKFLYDNSIWLEDFCMANSGAKRRRTSKADLLINQYANADDFLVALEDYRVAREDDQHYNKPLVIADAKNTLETYLWNYCFSYLSLYFKENKDELLRVYESKLSRWISQTLKDAERLNLDGVELQKKVISNSFESVFQNQYRKFGTNKSTILFTYNNREIHFEVDDEGERLDNIVFINNNIHFIESPKIFDYIANYRFGQETKATLRRMMVPNTFRTNIYPIANYRSNPSPVYDFEKELNPILNHLSDVMGGQAEFHQKTGLVFKDRVLDVPIKSANVSTGLKSIALLEYALRIGAIERGDILILDEPEINLHPEWQIEYAKAIVALQKIFDLKFIITSHSPFFMRAIECFTDINGTMDNLNVYRVSCSDRASMHEVTNVSYSEYGMSDLYEDLSEPLDKLDALLDEKYGAEDGE